MKAAHSITIVQSSVVPQMSAYTFPGLSRLRRRPSEVIVRSFHILTFVRRLLFSFAISSGSLCVDVRNGESVYLIRVVIGSACVCNHLE
jgi:hypothetical protein